MAEAPDEVREVRVGDGFPPAAARGLAEFVKKQYLNPDLDSLSGRSYKETWADDGRSVDLEWASAPGGSATRLSIGPQSVVVEFPGPQAQDEASRAVRRKVADDLELLVTTFLVRAKGTSLHFVFSTGGGSPGGGVSVPNSLRSETLKRIFSGNMTNLYLFIITVSFVLFFIIGDYAIVAVVVLQLLALFYSDRLALMVGTVRPTAEEPKVTVVSVSVPAETKQQLAKYGRGLLPEVRNRLEGGVSADPSGGPDAVGAVQAALSGVGIKSSPEEIRFVTRDVYSLVKRVADRFELPVPKITIMDAVADNAAATGVSPGRSSIAITVGSLEDLGDDELSSVVGHEFGHIRGRDSVILFCVTFLMYFGGLYAWFPLVVYLGLFYYLVAFAVIFSVGKVLETRADTESAATLGSPGVLASALTKIGFRQLYVERYSHQARFLDWLSFDPHPPIYFRVQRLSKLAATGGRIGNTLLVSLKDCVSGFLQAIR